MDQIYRCYHSPTNRLTEVQWEEPTIERNTQLLMKGFVSLLFLIGLTVAALYAFAMIDDNPEDTNRNLQDDTVSRVSIPRLRNTQLISSTSRPRPYRSSRSTTVRRRRKTKYSVNLSTIDIVPFPT